MLCVPFVVPAALVVAILEVCIGLSNDTEDFLVSSLVSLLLSLTGIAGVGMFFSGHDLLGALFVGYAVLTIIVGMFDN
jgi:hypothetical protein